MKEKLLFPVAGAWFVAFTGMCGMGLHKVEPELSDSFLYGSAFVVEPTNLLG